MIDNHTAIIDDNRTISFSELTSIVNRTAQYYFEKGIKDSSTVAILANNSLEYVITIYALWNLGAIPAPLNTRLTSNEITSIVNNSNFNFIIIDDSFFNIQTQIKSINMAIKYEGNEYSKKVEAMPNGIAVIIHTSGSSGKPKGVEITNSNLYQSYLSLTDSFRFNPKDRFLASLPFYHIGGFAIISRALLAGSILVIPQNLKQDSIENAIIKYEPSVVSLVPTMLSRIIENDIKPNSNMKCLFLGGGASSDELIHTALERNWPIVKVYGSSETTAMVTGCWGEELHKFPACAGNPFNEIEIKILNEEKAELNSGEVGEIAIKSKTIASGYLNNSKLWNHKLHNDFYLTGDYGYLDNDGRLFVVARRTDLIVSGGENIDPREIEDTLNTHSSIMESIVFPTQNDDWGEIATALVVLNKEANFEIDKIQLYLKSKLASFKVPKIISIVTEIPRTELGKIDLAKCKSIVLKGN